MGYNITYYCPDQHISYDLYTLENEGVGGGITARVRMAHALAMRGHCVIAYVNCPNERNILGVEYRHISTIDDHSIDIFIAGTSGDGLVCARAGWQVACRAAHPDAAFRWDAGVVRLP